MRAIALLLATCLLPCVTAFHVSSAAVRPGATLSSVSSRLPFKMMAEEEEATDETAADGAEMSMEELNANPAPAEEESKFFQIMDKGSNIVTALFAIVVLLQILGVIGTPGAAPPK